MTAHGREFSPGRGIFIAGRKHNRFRKKRIKISRWLESPFSRSRVYRSGGSREVHDNIKLRYRRNP